MRATLQGLNVNDTLNVTDDDAYNNVSDDDDQLTQRQNQPSEYGCHLDPSSRKNHYVTSPDRKLSNHHLAVNYILHLLINLGLIPLSVVTLLIYLTVIVGLNHLIGYLICVNVVIITVIDVHLHQIDLL